MGPEGKPWQGDGSSRKTDISSTNKIFYNNQSQRWCWTVPAWDLQVENLRWNLNSTSHKLSGLDRLLSTLIFSILIYELEIIIVTISWGLNEYVECLEQCLRHRKYSITLAVTGITHLSSIFYSEPDVGGMMLNNSWWWPSAHPLFNQGNRETSTARIRSTKVGVLFSILLS